VEPACPGCCVDDECTVNSDGFEVGGDFDYFLEYDVRSECTNGMDIEIFLRCQTGKDEMIIYADTIQVFTTGCVSGDNYGTAIIPPGTASVAIEINHACDGPSTFWLFAHTCYN